MVKENKPQVLFLVETKCRQHRIEGLCVKFGFAGAFSVESVGRSRGLALLWKKEGELEIQNFSRRHINAIVVKPGLRGHS